MASTNEALLLAQVSFLLNPPLCTTYQTAVQSIANATFVALAFDTNEVDTYSGHSTVTNNTRYTAQVAGYYQFSGLVAFATSGVGERRAQFALNGAGVIGTQVLGPSTAVSTSGLAVATRSIFLNVNDYVELQAWQNTGGALNSSAGAGTAACTMSARWVHQ